MLGPGRDEATKSVKWEKRKRVEVGKSRRRKEWKSQMEMA